MAETRLKAKLLCTAQHFFDADRAVAELMPNLSWISSHPVKASQHDKAGQSLVCHAWRLRIHVDLDAEFRRTIIIAAAGVGRTNFNLVLLAVSFCSGPVLL